MVTLTIVLSDDGKVSVTGPLHDKVMMAGLLEVAKQVVMNVQQPELPVAPKPGSLDVSYRCSICDKPVSVTVRDGREPKIAWTCGHDGQKVIAWLSGSLKRVAPVPTAAM